MEHWQVLADLPLSHLCGFLTPVGDGLQCPAPSHFLKPILSMKLPLILTDGKQNKLHARPVLLSMFKVTQLVPSRGERVSPRFESRVCFGRWNMSKHNTWSG